MAMTLHVDIVSAEGEIFSGQAELVVAPGEEGEVGIVARHAPFLSPLKPGEVRIKTEGQEPLSFYVSGGMLEVQPYLVTILSETALRAKDIDEAAALEAKRLAEEALADRTSQLEYAKARALLAEAMAQLRTLENYRKSRS
jgi:F-type H+-transporting ATPase subunit epsilon